MTRARKDAPSGGGSTATLSAVRFSAEELLALGESLGTSGFPGVDESTLGDLDPAARATAIRTAHRSLLARGVLEITPDGIRLAPLLEPSIATVTRPRLVVNVDRRTHEARNAVVISAVPGSAVELAVAPGGLYVLTPFPAKALVERTIRRAELVDRPAHEVPPMDLTARQMARLRETRGEVDPAEMGEGATPFIRAFAKSVGATHLRILAHDGGRLAGGSVSWIDGGALGLWLLEPIGAPSVTSDDGTPSPCAVRPTSAKELLAMLLSFLPDSTGTPTA